MNANELADYLDNNVEAMIMSEQTHIDQAATMLRQQQEQIENLKQWEKRQLDVIEALKQIIDANNLNQNIGQFVKPDLTIEEVMSENCTCYKLGYSPLNDYASVKQK
jgi:hypothetical protein